jgi:NADPH2:quinone reductase
MGSDPTISELFRNCVSVSAFWLQTLAQNQGELNTVLSELIEIVDRHELRPVIGRIYPLQDASQAWHDLESRKSTGKLLLKP